MKRLTATVIVLVAGFGQAASAHTKNNSLGDPAGATDIWLVTCATGDAVNGKLEVSVKNVTPSSPLLSVHVSRDGATESATDAVSGDANFSPKVTLAKGDGGYTVTLDKAGAGGLNYALEYHCKTGGGLHTGDDTSIAPIQDDGEQTPPPPADTRVEPTEIKDEAAELTTHYTGIAIGQGCQDDAKSSAPKPVKAMSSVFPNATDSKAFKIETDGSETPIALSDYIENASGGVISLSPGIVQDRSVFKKLTEIVDASGKVRGFDVRSGKLGGDAIGVIPFHVTTPAFKAGTCAKRLLIRIAVANYCNTSRNTNKDDRADIWMGGTTGMFNDPGIMPPDFAADPYWPTLTVNRDLAKKPLAGGCGSGFDIAVQPSESDIDTYLPVKGFWPR
ncbi:MAG: hypothetical protein ACU841_09665 [Gammaproteobacteria bacterium]